uniref:Uncharacterized protein n=1 Tax=Amphimedon queenslandica TaxID=400682 RepID=A0A1X7TMQ5_AMPQE
MTLKRNKGGYKCHRFGSTQHFIRDCPFRGWGATKEARGAESEDSNKYGNHVAQLYVSLQSLQYYKEVRHAVWNMMCSTSFIWLLN